MEPEVKYNSLREHFSEHWGPHSSLDVTKIKQELTEMQGDDPGWRKYLQNFNYFVGSLEQTMQRDANDAVIYGPAPAAIYPARPPGLYPFLKNVPPNVPFFYHFPITGLKCRYMVLIYAIWEKIFKYFDGRVTRNSFLFYFSEEIL
jgi:hypothetical protein